MPQPSDIKILVVEDEPTLRLALQDALESEKYSVDAVEDGNSGLEKFKIGQHTIVLTDLIMPGLDGLQLIEKINNLNPNTVIFAFTAHGNVDTAVKAMKLGAADFITKPFNVNELVERIKFEVNQLSNNDDNDERDRFGQIVGRSKVMLELYDLIETIAPSDANVLVQGESGTGKELVAEAMHFNSPRRDKPFIKVSCASLTETLLESELFGHEKGAFTGALNRKIGRFEQAHGGTLFLDEIGDVSETVQVKLLRVLQEREFERVGGTETINVDVRIVSATLHDINDLVQRGRFREDLFYRINTVTIHLPNLTDRTEDIELLADHFREIHSNRLGKEVSGFTEESINHIRHYNWPGNARELKNAVERAVLMARDEEISLNDLPETIKNLQVAPLHTLPDKAKLKPCERPTPLEDALKCAEENHLRLVLEYTTFNRTKASEILGISRKTLWEKMRQYKIVDEKKGR